MHGQAGRPARLPVLGWVLPDLIRNGRLTVIDADGGTARFGDAASGLHVTLRLRDRDLPIRIALDPAMVMGEAYMDGRIKIESGTIRDLLLLATANLELLYQKPLPRLMNYLRKLQRLWSGTNNRIASRRNVGHHYDLPPELYDLFLDTDRIYSCAYFPTGCETIEVAQLAKIRHLAAKLLIKPDDRVLDIGCGWGALATTLAVDAGARVDGITLSAEQLGAAKRRARLLGVENRARFELCDYRDVNGRYDRIVSVGMLEHVGTRHFDAYFRKIASLLEVDGIAVVHSIGHANVTTGSDPWINRYIFPGGHIPTLSQVLPAIERAGLWLTDIEILHGQYNLTLQRWWDRFQKNREAARDLMGERFCRMWEYYLAASEAGFQNRGLMVFQLQLTRERRAVPHTRDYISRFEARWQAPDPTPPPPGRDRHAARKPHDWVH